jgi:signal transduction histidine kinase/ActR/RegA family two-component response regulator
VAHTRASEASVGRAAAPEAAAAHALGSRGIYSHVNKEGVAITAYYVKLPSTEWKVVVGVPTELLEAPVLHLLRFMLELGFAALAMAGVLAFWIGRHMNRQIAAVARAAIAVGKGQEPARDSSNVREINEVSGALAAAGDLIAAREATLRESETRQALRLRLVQGQRETNDPEAMMLAACEAVGRHLGANRVSFFDMLDDDTLDFTVGWTDGTLDRMTGIFPAEGIGKTYLDRVRCGAMPGIAEVAKDPFTADSIFSSIRICSGIGVPIIRNDSWQAGLYVHHATDRQWTAAELALVHEVSDQTWDAVERGRAASALGKSETSLRLSQQAGRIGSWDWDGVTGKLHWSELQCQQFGVDPVSRNQITYDVLRNAVHPDDLAAAEAKLRAAFADGTDFEIEYRINTPDGVRWMNGSGHVFRDTDGNAVRLIGIDMDVTERRTLEDELRALTKTLEARVQKEIATREAAQARAAHAERLQALGQLASGIAHDFNNVLQAVGGAMTLIGRRPGDEPGIRRLAQLASEAIERGASITRRLLVFGRRGDLRAETIDAAALLHDLREILAHTLRVNIDIEVRLDSDLRPFVADKSQLETSLINLATNARDAMPAGGKLTLAAAIEVVPRDTARHAAGLAPGCYIRLSIEDTGTGMDAGTLARASDPFFTTKEVGAGTGLGLAMSKGFAEQSGGGLRIESSPGQGTTVAIWLPEADAAAVGALAPQLVAKTAEPPNSDGAKRVRVLLIDDNYPVREVLAMELENAGYSVLAAGSGAEALALLDAGETVAALVTDLSMPGMDGLEVIRTVQQRHGSLPAVLLTGYVGDTAALAVSGAVSGVFSLLQRPVSGTHLIERLGALLADRLEAPR